ncbi:MAG: hypothetical protein J5496_02765 [Lachnospiraceae bacterium]|nr:hypothetical protein [Lachnospiraceae bacterium]
MRNNGDEYQKLILSQQSYSSSTIPFKRGNIVDTKGTLLAYSEEVYNLILDPSVILYTARAAEPEPNRQATVDALVACFGFDRTDLENTLSNNPAAMYIRYAQKLSAEDVNRFTLYQSNYNTAEDAAGKAVHKDKVTGVWFETEYQRAYPYHEKACTVLGFSGTDSSEGHWGIEEYYNEYLSGINGKSYSYINQDGESEKVLQEATDGYTVVSTIDWFIQSIVEEKIGAYKAEKGYKNIGVIVMDPSSTEILAMATDKCFDPSDPTDLSLTYGKESLEGLSEEELADLQNQMWRNFTISDVFPPGSVAKELTVAMALEEAVVTPDTLFVCDGGEEFGDGLVIHCHNRDGHGILNLEETLMNSCNDAMMNIASRVTAATMIRYQRLFGLGSRTGVDLPGEATGIIFDANTMSAVDMATSSFGQGFSSTMIQMASSYCSLINGGFYYQPRIVSRIQDENGNTVKSFEPELVRKTVTEETSAFLRTAAKHTVDQGVGNIDGYDIGGKTGTANKYPIEEDQYVVSFMAFVPTDNPTLLVYAVIDEPVLKVSKEAIDLEVSIMKEILEYRGVHKAQ